MSKDTKVDEYSLVVVGSGGVGKSCLTVRFLKDEFMSEYDPTIEENFRKKISLEANYECLLNIIDTAGQQEYSSLRDQQLRTGQGFLLVYAINDESSFDEIKELYAAIVRAKESTTKVSFVIAGNKMDLESERTVDQAAAKAFAEQIKAPHFETSAKTNVNVEKSFHTLVQEIRKNGGGSVSSKSGSGTKKKSGGCVLL